MQPRRIPRKLKKRWAKYWPTATGEALEAICSAYGLERIRNRRTRYKEPDALFHARAKAAWGSLAPTWHELVTTYGS